MTNWTVNRPPELPHRRATMHIERTWGDKFKVTKWYCGGANMFGGYNYSKAKTYIQTTNTILDSLKSELFDVTWQSQEVLDKFRIASGFALPTEEVKPR